MFRRKLLPPLSIFLLFLLVFASAAAELNVSVQPQDLTVGMRGYVVVSAKDVNSIQLGKMPAQVSGIEWNNGVSSGSSMTIINGVRTSEYTLRISFTALKEGEFTVPPLDVIVTSGSRKQEKVKTESVPFKIAAAPRFDPAERTDAPAYALMTLPGHDDDKPASFWVGEEIPVRLSFYIQDQYDFRFANYPEIKSDNDRVSIRLRDYGRINPNSPNYESTSTKTMRIGNRLYTVYDFNSRVRAMSPGQLRLVSDTAMVEDTFFLFGNPRRISVPSQSQEITIKPLPAPPADAPFTGLVGKWKTAASLSPGPYRVGEPLSLKIDFAGKDSAGMPKLPEIEPEHFRAYPPEMKETATGISASCVLIPLEGGKQSISFVCSTFDTGSGKYEPFRFERTIEVTGTAAAAPAATQPADRPPIREPVRASGSEADAEHESSLYYLHDEGDGGLVALPLIMNAIWISLGLILAGLTYAGGSAFVCARRRVLESDPSARRRIDARARRGVLVSAIAKTPPQDLPDKVGADLTAFFNDMLDLPPGTALGETAARVKETAPELGQQLEDLANTAWMPSLRGGLDERFRSRLTDAVRKFGIFAAVLLALCLGMSARTASAGEDTQPQSGSAASMPAETGSGEDAAKSASGENALAEASVPTSAEEAKKAYDAGEFRRALDYYASKLDPRRVSPALLYNMGNCCYQLGDYPRALICYERARRLQPRNSDISGNLELTRNKLGLPPKYVVETPADFLLAARDHLRLDEWLVVCAAGLTLMLIALGIFVRRRSNLWQWPFYAGIVVTVVCAAALIAKVSADDPAREAVVIAPAAPLYSLPSAESGREKQRLKAGAEVLIEENRPDWIRVRLENGDEGWVRNDDLALLWSDSPGDIATRPDAAP